MTKTMFHIAISGPQPLDCGDCPFSSGDAMDQSPHCDAEEFITGDMILLPAWNNKNYGKVPKFCPIGKNRLFEETHDDDDEDY